MVETTGKCNLLEVCAESTGGVLTMRCRHIDLCTHVHAPLPPLVNVRKIGLGESERSLQAISDLVSVSTKTYRKTGFVFKGQNYKMKEVWMCLWNRVCEEKQDGDGTRLMYK